MRETLPPGDPTPEEGTGRRGRRDAVVDALLIGACLLVWAEAAVGYGIGLHERPGWPGWREWPDLPAWLVGPDLVLGLVACLALWWRRRHPVAVALAVGTIAAIAMSAVGALVVSMVGVAAYRPWTHALPPVVLTVVLGVPWSLMVPATTEERVATVATATLIVVACMGWGVAVRARRQLVERLREDVRRQRREHERRLETARADERGRIAREMHDVVAHRMSLLSVHAGALAYRTERAESGRAAPLDPAEIGEAVRVIRDNAHLALDELGDILQVLRSGETAPSGTDDHAGTAAPRPGLAGVRRLVEEAVAAGQRVTCELDLPEDAEPAGQVGRTAYRVVQEGLTNARKHAPGARAHVEVAGGPGRGLQVAVVNALPARVADTAIPGAGAGLAGLAERVGLDGGRLLHGPAGGRFRLAADLPWSESAPGELRSGMAEWGP
ncbi:sensor histidine kinase [Nocardiopsis aegyptia]|uniref:histidine kinase n=1 Tax=Nocardiopsis aegyptia TaxID=220378 RepID=A0A7Z0ESN5_9ACTN|nr:histidine kinase [Nocardiopsis aegyptia]NYJ37026.1 signal transduction histidine kinase [Nocardiopsis aegyptia]